MKRYLIVTVLSCIFFLIQCNQNQIALVVRRLPLCSIPSFGGAMLCLYLYSWEPNTIHILHYHNPLLSSITSWSTKSSCSLITKLCGSFFLVQLLTVWHPTVQDFLRRKYYTFKSSVFLISCLFGLKSLAIFWIMLYTVLFHCDQSVAEFHTGRIQVIFSVSAATLS